MSAAWLLVPLGEVLRPIGRGELIDPNVTYRLLGAHWYGKGLYVKDIRPGSEIRAPKVFRVEQGDFVYNRLFGWKGSFAVATAENHGCYVSNEFPCFAVDSNLLEDQYLRWYFTQPSAWQEALGLSAGGTPTSRNRLKEEKLLGMRIPLPSLPEQRRIVARLEELAAKIQEARALRTQAVAGLDRLLIAMAHGSDLDQAGKQREGWTEARIEDVVSQVKDVHQVRADGTYPNFGIYSFGTGLFKKSPIFGNSTSAQVLYRVRSGQFIYSRLFAFEGAYGMVTTEFDGHFVSGEYPVFECDSSRVRAEFLYTYFKSPVVWEQVAAGSKGLGHRRQRVQPAQILAHRLMLPPMQWQDQIVDVLARSKPVKGLQAETTVELEALLPSILEKAFRGS